MSKTSFWARIKAGVPPCGSSHSVLYCHLLKTNLLKHIFDKELTVNNATKYWFFLYAKGKHAVGTCAYCKVGIKERHLDFNLVVSWMCYCFHRIASLFDSTSVIISKLKSELVTSKKIIYTSLAHCTIPANKLKIKNGENLYLFCQLDSFSIPNGFLGRSSGNNEAK